TYAVPQLPPHDLLHPLSSGVFDFVEGHTKRLQLHRQVVVAVIGNEEESGDPGAIGVEVNVRLDVELVSADDLTVV
ncbi:hypothetical protein A2U01_0101417, partial [Trifolium medium]|nr:hypothetical protein [Trifolium medium]